MAASHQRWCSRAREQSYQPKDESECGATGGASDQQHVTVTENFEHYLGE